MSVLAVPVPDDPSAPATAPRSSPRPALGLVHEHDWRLVQVDYTDGACIREFGCSCRAVWFA